MDYTEEYSEVQDYQKVYDEELQTLYDNIKDYLFKVGIYNELFSKCNVHAFEDFLGCCRLNKPWKERSVHDKIWAENYIEELEYIRNYIQTWIGIFVNKEQFFNFVFSYSD